MSYNIRATLKEWIKSFDSPGSIFHNPDSFRVQMESILEKEGIQINPDVATNVGNLIGLYHGYRKAYLTLSEELGILRQTAAPIVRNQSPVDPGFFGRIGIWAEQVKQPSKVEKPSIFLVTLPKSATVFVGHSIAQTLEYDITSTLVTPTFPKNIIWGPMLLDFLRGGMVSASHLQPDDTNLTLLKRTGVKQIVLHIRDPRAALLS
ncbi:MAG: hypothetical protein ACREX4_17105, partial [Gammaproteobacteria bacterium]